MYKIPKFYGITKALNGQRNLKKLEKVKHLRPKHITKRSMVAYMQSQNFGGWHWSTLSLAWLPKERLSLKNMRAIVQLLTEGLPSKSQAQVPSTHKKERLSPILQHNEMTILTHSKN